MAGIERHSPAEGLLGRFKATGGFKDLRVFRPQVRAIRLALDSIRIDALGLCDAAGADELVWFSAGAIGRA